MYIQDKKHYSIVLIISFLFFFAPTFSVSAATLTVQSQKNTYTVGDTIIVRVLAASDVSMNAASGVLTFLPQFLSLVSVSKENSFVDMWLKDPVETHEDGRVVFEGVGLKGYSGKEALVFTLIFKATSHGVAQINFSSALILANNGKGTKLTSRTHGLNIIIQPTPLIQIPTSKNITLNPSLNISPNPVFIDTSMSLNHTISRVPSSVVTKKSFSSIKSIFIILAVVLFSSMLIFLIASIIHSSHALKEILKKKVEHIDEKEIDTIPKPPYA